MKEQQKSLTISKRLILRRAEDLMVLDKAKVVEAANIAVKSEHEDIVNEYVEVIKNMKVEDYLYQACEDYAKKYNMSCMKVYNEIKESCQK
jgi:hypothetical protein